MTFRGLLFFFSALLSITSYANEGETLKQDALYFSDCSGYAKFYYEREYENAFDKRSWGLFYRPAVTLMRKYYDEVKGYDGEKVKRMASNAVAERMGFQEGYVTSISDFSSYEVAKAIASEKIQQCFSKREEKGF